MDLFDPHSPQDLIFFAKEYIQAPRFAGEQIAMEGKSKKKCCKKYKKSKKCKSCPKR